MTYGELRDLVVDTLGEDIIDTETLLSGVSNAFADISSRGYRDFEIKKYFPTDLIVNKDGYAKFDLPKNLSKILYIKIFHKLGVSTPTRFNVSNPFIESLRDTDGIYRTNLISLNQFSIFYTKEKKCFIEFLSTKGVIEFIEVGYNRRLIPHKKSESDEDITDIDIEVREELASALVFYLTWFFAVRQNESPERLSMHYNVYKYYMEDMLSELQHEDSYTSVSGIQVEEDD
jgi:hypothetical protein